jgi:Reverse transcriptase (RNA-dependent DNA polymerase)./Integrase core domain.
VPVKGVDYDLLNPTKSSTQRTKPQISLQKKHRELRKSMRDQKRILMKEILRTGKARRAWTDESTTSVAAVDVVASIRARIEVLADKERLLGFERDLRSEYTDVFDPLPHYDDLSDDVHCKIKLKDAGKTISTRTYSCPRKYRDAWKTLIQQHLDAGRIRPSSSQYASPAFIVPKSDPTVLPRWVNDYRQLNANTVTDCYPLPRVEDILADASRGKVWSKMDMTNSFFHTRVHPDSVPLTAITTPFGLYEWLVMPMGLRNSPPIHQRRVANTLCDLIGKICHIYLDDIIIWSNSVEEHQKHVRLVMDCLRKHGLRLNGKKSEFFVTELDFLGHHISPRGIEANSSKVDKILNWPVLKTASDVRSFLGLVRYITVFLPKLAEYTCVLTRLTLKEADKSFPGWSEADQAAFDAIKGLVVSRECLTVIDHENPGENRIFVTTDASNLRTGAVLSWGKCWKTARPVAFDSMQLNSAQKKYPVHEKELLAIVRALKKWRADLLGGPITIFTDHKTLENFDGQKDLSRRQARWQEFMSQFEMEITYIKGEENTVADALSRLPVEKEDEAPVKESSKYASWLLNKSINATMSISADSEFLLDVKRGYLEDEFTKKLLLSKSTVPGVTESNGLWYIDGRLIIPRIASCREDLFRLAHDTMGHFGADKSYATLRDGYYWPNMRRDLESAYVPACMECQRNKSSTQKPQGPLHPLPIPDDCGSSVAIDFIGPLPEDDGYNCIMSLTDRLGSDVRIVPTRTDITAEDCALLFFRNWYCENGLPAEIISDRDKLFVSKFWRMLHKLTGVKLKMSTAFHPQSDGSSERLNKTINQCL